MCLSRQRSCTSASYELVVTLAASSCVSQCYSVLSKREGNNIVAIVRPFLRARRMAHRPATAGPYSRLCGWNILAGDMLGSRTEYMQ